MSVFVFGASNSVMEEGWVPTLAHERGDVVNRSVGASTSHMALFRLMGCDEIRAGDVAVWEYAINDGNARANEQASTENLLAYVERFLIEARRLGVRVAPLLIPSRDWAHDGPGVAHSRALETLFRSYDLTPVSLMDRFQTAFGNPIPGDVYKDPFHISVALETKTHLLDAAKDAIQEARVPCDRSRQFTRPERIAVYLGHPGGQTRRYKNSFIDIPVARGSTRWLLPAPGRLLSAYFVTSPHHYQASFTLQKGRDAGLTLHLAATTGRRKRLLRGGAFAAEPRFEASTQLETRFHRTRTFSWDRFRRDLSLESLKRLGKQEPYFAGFLTAYDEVET